MANDYTDESERRETEFQGGMFGYTAGLGGKALQFLFEPEIKIGKWLMSSGKTETPTAGDWFWTAVGLVGIGKAGKIGKSALAWTAKHPTAVVGGALTAYGYKKMKEKEPGMAEAFWEPSGMATMGMWGAKEAAEGVTAPIGQAIRGGYWDVAEKGLKDVRLRRTEIKSYYDKASKISPAMDVIVGLTIDRLDRRIEQYQEQVDFHKFARPLQDYITKELEIENKSRMKNMKEVDLTNKAMNENAAYITKLKQIRLRTSADIGGITVNTELDAMTAVSVGRFKVMQAQLDKLNSPDAYATVNAMKQDYTMIAKQESVTFTQVNLWYTQAATGTKAKDVAGQATVLLHMVREYNSTVMDLAIEQEYREAEASDTATQKLNETIKAQQILNLDYQLAYIKKYDELGLFVMDVEDSNTAQYKTLASIKDGLDKVWDEQALLKSSAETFKTNIEKNEDKISEYKRTLQLLRENEITAAKNKMEELNMNIESMFMPRP